MGFFILLLLSFCCCQAIPLQSQEVDCDDPAVFNAVDLALQKFNGERMYGHQFALVVVTKARRTEGYGTNFLIDVKYRLRETVCAAGEGIPWQNCEFRDPLEADSGECEARVYTDNLFGSVNVSQECRIVPAEGKVTASRAPCTGCWNPLSPHSLELLPLVRHTIRRFNNQDYHPSLFEVLEITKALSQVVAGWNYAFEYLVKETNCSKAEFPDLTPACKRIPEGRQGRCFAAAHVNITYGLSYAVQECRLEVTEDVARRRSCPGCPRQIATNSTQLKEPLTVALKMYNSESNSEAYYKVEEILQATAQVVAGMKYHVEFIIVKTNCSKANLKELSEEDCHPEERGERRQCTASIYVIPWESKILPNVTCEVYHLRAALAYAAWPPGMTPFRSLKLAESFPSVAEDRRGQKGPGPKKGLGAAPSRDLDHKRGREPTKEESSEESHEGVGQQEEISPGPVPRNLEVQPSLAKPCLQAEEANEDGAGCPVPPTQQESTDFSVTDLLPERDAPKCPGKLWKPITALPTTDTGLVFGVGGDAEDNPASSPQDFDLADALYSY